MSTWKEIWEKRKLLNIEVGSEKNDVLANLLAMDGFDSGTGKIEPSPWRAFIQEIIERYRITPDDTVFEVGCGAGAFLYPFHLHGCSVGGLDYSHALIGECRKLFESDQFEAGQAIELDSTDEYDYVVAFSVFFYFPDYNYAKDVVRKMLKKARKGVFILDVPNLETMEMCEDVRRGTLPPGEYEKKYKGLNHLYYARSFFEGVANSEKSSVCIEDQSIAGYLNNQFRFNCWIRK